MLEYVSSKQLDATRHQVILAGAEKVQVEPVSELHLKADPDQIRALLNRDIDNETTGQVV